MAVLVLHCTKVEKGVFQGFYRQGENERKILKTLQQIYVQSMFMWPSNVTYIEFNPLNAQLNPICYLLVLLGAHHFLHVSRIRVKSLTFRLLMSYIYGAPIFDVSRSQQASGPAAARLLRSWVRIPPGHGYLSVVSVVCCQVEVSATS